MHMGQCVKGLEVASRYVRTVHSGIAATWQTQTENDTTDASRVAMAITLLALPCAGDHKFPATAPYLGLKNGTAPVIGRRSNGQTSLCKLLRQVLQIWWPHGEMTVSTSRV